ncbi:MAG: Mor transcription activator family protein [Deferribacterales bacterium]
MQITLDDLTGDTRLIADAIFLAARNEGLPDEQARKIAVAAIIRVGSDTGGMNIYIHSTKQMLRPERDREIMAKFTGGNVRQLAKDFELSESHVRAIIRRSSRAISLSDLLEDDI